MNHDVGLDAFVNDLYSASNENKATIGCFYKCQVTKKTSNLKIKLVVDFETYVVFA